MDKEKIVNSINKYGFCNIEPEPYLDIISDILRMKKEKDIIILAHYYQKGEIQDIADYVGDSLALAQIAEKNNSKMILLAGVHFMAETVKILTPEKKILIPDINAGCSLADSCPPQKFKEFIDSHPNHTVISYVNTTAEIKTLTDIVCTSTNALQIIESLPKNEKIIFAPDKNLGNYIRSISGRDMILWDGACHVHEKFSVERILELKKQYPKAKIIAHPECERPVQIIADHIGSTSSLLKFTIQDKANEFIVATESGIIHQMKKENPDKIFITAPPKDSTCACNDCEYMKLISIKKIWATLKYEMPEIILSSEIIEKASYSIQRMLKISDKLGL
ncbi:MAG: quinolinate synthase NadA [Bacteroidota bacterium]|nr:quinolinate synthase NadA [Bacteroidota bacterium]